VAASTPVDVARAVVVDVATAIATTLGLGDAARPGASWPAGAGDALLRAPLAGDVVGSIVLAVNADVAQRLVDGGGRELATAMQAAADLVAGVTGRSVTVAPVTVELLEADATSIPMAVGEIVDDGRLTALVGCDLVSIAERIAERIADQIAGAVADPVADNGTGAGRYEPETFDREPHAPRPSGPRGPLSVLSDVEMVVTAELGRTTMPMRELLGLTPGMVVEIDRAAGSPIDLLVNGRRIASGEVVVIDEEFGIRITEICPTPEAG
jgi:flagellar motor switch protein FliN/FliY